MIPKIKVTKAFVSYMKQQEKQYIIQRDKIYEEILQDLHAQLK